MKTCSDDELFGLYCYLNVLCNCEEFQVLDSIFLTTKVEKIPIDFSLAYLVFTCAFPQRFAYRELFFKRLKAYLDKEGQDSEEILKNL